MRTPTIGTPVYAPGEPPQDQAEQVRFLRTELQSIGSAINALALGHLDPTHVVPIKPRSGDIRLADGTDWNPGSGQGVYCYYGAAWHLLG